MVSGGGAPVAGAIPQESRINAELLARRIAPDTFVVTHEPFFAANILVVRMSDGSVVLCSSPVESESTRALVTWVHEKLRPSRIVAINTHFHLDGTGGNEAYQALSVTTYGSALTQRLLRERGEALRTATAGMLVVPAHQRRVAAMKLVPARHTFAETEGLVLSFGTEQVRVLFPGAAHSPDNLLVHFPARGLLFGGCMIKASSQVGFVGDADLTHWERAVDIARGLGARIVVPGHGHTGGPELFDLTVSVVREARKSARTPGPKATLWP